MSASGDRVPSVGRVVPASTRALRSSTIRKQRRKIIDHNSSTEDDSDEVTSRPPVKKRKILETEKTKAEEKKPGAKKQESTEEKLLVEIQVVSKREAGEKEKRIKETIEKGYERRRRGFRSQPPKSYLEKLARAQSQR